MAGDITKGKKEHQLIHPDLGLLDYSNIGGAHGAIDSKISQNNLNPNNIKNKVRSETLDLYDIFPDPVYNRGEAIFTGQTEGGDTRFYKRPFDMPRDYYSDDDITKDQIMQVLKNAIRQSPDDTTSTQDIKDLYKLHKQSMPKYQEGGFIDKISSLFGKGGKEESEVLGGEDLKRLFGGVNWRDSDKSESRFSFEDMMKIAGTAELEGSDSRHKGSGAERQIFKLLMPEGERYYGSAPHSGATKERNPALEAVLRAAYSPSDSLSVGDLEGLKQGGAYKLFE